MPRYERDLSNSETVNAGATGTLLSHRWIGEQGTIYQLGIGIDDGTLWATATFNLLVNGVPVLDYGTIRDQISVADAVSSVRIPVPPYATIELTATNGGVAAGLFFGRLVCRSDK